MIPAPAVAASSPELLAAASAVAAALGLPLASGEATGLQLRCTPAGLELYDPGERCAVRCDLVGGAAGYRQRHAGGDQALARAVGVRGGRRPGVVDATAGLGRDGCLLAALGCRVTLLERSAVIHALLRDGLQRALATPAFAAQVGDRLQLLHADAADWLAAHPVGSAAAVVYLDPMHPPRRSSALVRKEMRLLRAAVGADADAARLLPLALAAAAERVVVKRPAGAEPLAGVAPDWVIGGRTTRFDVYRALPASAR
ncbi:MAG TPA: class I SAM-dependent methyltransferase [Gammaproteobacteria bacterium]